MTPGLKPDRVCSMHWPGNPVCFVFGQSNLYRAFLLISHTHTLSDQKRKWTWWIWTPALIQSKFFIPLFYFFFTSSFFPLCLFSPSQTLTDTSLGHRQNPSGSRCVPGWLLCDVMSHSSDINRRPSCLVAADSASDTLTRAQHALALLLLTGLAGEYYWMSIWPHYKCVATGNRLGGEGGGGGGKRRRGRGKGGPVASWDRNLTSLSFFFFLPFLFFLASLAEATRVLPCAGTCACGRAQFAKSRVHKPERENRRSDEKFWQEHNLVSLARTCGS